MARAALGATLGQRAVRPMVQLRARTNLSGTEGIVPLCVGPPCYSQTSRIGGSSMLLHLGAAFAR